MVACVGFWFGVRLQGLGRSLHSNGVLLVTQRRGNEYSGGANTKIGEDAHKAAGLGIAEIVDLLHSPPSLQPRSTVLEDFGAKGFMDESSSTLSFQCLVLTIDEKVCRKALIPAVILA